MHRVRRLPLKHLVEGHQEELVLSELPEAGNYSAVGVLALEHSHNVELLTASTPVTKPEK